MIVICEAIYIQEGWLFIHLIIESHLVWCVRKLDKMFWKKLQTCMNNVHVYSKHVYISDIPGPDSTTDCDTAFLSKVHEEQVHHV